VRKPAQARPVRRPNVAGTKGRSLRIPTGESLRDRAAPADTGDVLTAKTPAASEDREHPAAKSTGVRAKLADSPGLRGELILLAIAIVLTVLAVVSYFRPGAAADSNAAWVDAAATAEVLAATAEALTTVYSYSWETIDQDFAATREYLTDEMRSEFDATSEVTKQSAVQRVATVDATMVDLGIVLLDGERAELVAHMEVTSTMLATPEEAWSSRAVDLVVGAEKVDGAWLLSRIDPV
jgi:hypothetical protein